MQIIIINIKSCKDTGFPQLLEYLQATDSSIVYSNVRVWEGLIIPIQEGWYLELTGFILYLTDIVPVITDFGVRYDTSSSTNSI